MNIALFGMTGGTGRHFALHAALAGHRIRALVRRPESLTFRHDHITVVKGDLKDDASTANAMEGTEAVVFTAGWSSDKLWEGRKGTDIYSRGIESVLSGMKRHRLQRIVAVTSLGTTDNPDEPAFYRYVIQGFFLRKIYDDMIAMERMLQDSEVDFTIVRPPLLVDGPPGGLVRTSTTGELPGTNTIRRADLGRFLLDALNDPSLSRAIVAVGD